MSTALELGPAKWKTYVGPARKALAASESESIVDPARELLWLRIRAAAEMLKSRFGARRVVLFGSLAHQAWYAPHSDVDLAVEGLPPSAYWSAWRLVEEMIGDRSVDLLDIETSSDSLRRSIDEHGIAL